MKHAIFSFRNTLIAALVLVALLIPIPFILRFVQAGMKFEALLYDASASESRVDWPGGLLWTLGYLKVESPVQDNKGDGAEWAGWTESDLYGSPHIEKRRSLAAAPRYPDLLYFGGGNDEAPNFTAADAYEIRRRLVNGSILIAEASFVATAAPGPARTELNTITGVHLSGWKGRYFRDLSRKELIPAKIVENRELAEGPWNFTGGGLVLARDDGEIVILRDEMELAADKVSVLPATGSEKTWGLEDRIRFEDWFSIAEPTPGARRIADFSIHATEEGRLLLTKAGIPPDFPAITLHNQDAGLVYFLAASFGAAPDRLARLIPAGYGEFKTLLSAVAADPRAGPFWKIYVPFMKSVMTETSRVAADRVSAERAASDTSVPTATVLPQKVGIEGIQLLSRISGKSMQVQQSGVWKPFIIKGVNLGLALPNRWFTDMPRDAALYHRWFRQISAMNANSVRLYTLAPPEFYRALDDFNRSAGSPLYLLQEIWPDEEVPSHNYLDAAYDAAYKAEIRLTLDALHGAANIPERRGRAWGEYATDVSAWTLAYLVGRELEPLEIEATDRLNKDWTYSGRYLSAPAGSPSEAWLARACDTLVEYEYATWKRQTPTAAVGWPVLDPITHSSEWNAAGDSKLEYNDRAEFNIDHIEVGAANKAGFFGAFHIYPNYPDFMNNEKSYDAYTDKEGRLRYGGYLREFAQAQSRHPLLVAEFGLANGMATAHISPDGYDHGGIPEDAVAKGIARLMKAIVAENYIGGIVFEWMDEWAKKTWTTEPFMIPYDAQVHWHNMIDPEQNYGIIAMEAREPSQPFARLDHAGLAGPLELKANVEYLYLDFAFDAAGFLASGGRILIGLDTYDRQRGQFRYTRELDTLAPSGMEFLIDLIDGEAFLKAVPEYNIASYRFASRSRKDGVFEFVRPIVNKTRVRRDGSTIAELRAERLQFHFGDFGRSDANIVADATGLKLRLPWNALSVSDPLTLTVIDDARKFNTFPDRDELRTAKSDGLVVSAILVRDGKVLDTLPAEGSRGGWIVQPPALDPGDWRERPKAVYYALKELFGRLP